MTDETKFQLDTSGHVPQIAGDGDLKAVIWSGLDAFTQGYIEALFAAHSIELYRADTGRTFSHGAFDMLARETLARIIEDCTKAQTGYPGAEYHGGDGGKFWRQRALGGYPKTNPPLTVTLGDDGKVRFQ